MIKRIVNYSGGINSWKTAKRVVAEFGIAELHLVFADTLIEDNDLYRFLIESATNVFGLKNRKLTQLAKRALTILPLEDCLAESDLAIRKNQIRALQQECAKLIPGLVWLIEGRTPWEVFADVKFIGNTKADPCSMHLKRDFIDKWRDQNCDPKFTIIYFGIDWTEEDRFEGDADNKGIRRRLEEQGWVAEAPLCDEPLVTKKMIHQDLINAGIELPKLYKLGFQHNNCGAFCVKAGKYQFALLYQVMPRRYAYHEQKEKETMAIVGDHPILREQSDKVKGYVTLEQFRKQLEKSDKGYDIFGTPNKCACMNYEN